MTHYLWIPVAGINVLAALHRLLPCMVDSICDYRMKSQEGVEKYKTYRYIAHLYSLAVEARFYDDVGRVKANLVNQS